MIDALFQLLVHGDYIPWWNSIGIAEDHPLIDLILYATGR